MHQWKPVCQFMGHHRNSRHRTNIFSQTDRIVRVTDRLHIGDTLCQAVVAARNIQPKLQADCCCLDLYMACNWVFYSYCFFVTKTLPYKKYVFYCLPKILRGCLWEVGHLWTFTSFIDFVPFLSNSDLCRTGPSLEKSMWKSHGTVSKWTKPRENQTW